MKIFIIKSNIKKQYLLFLILFFLIFSIKFNFFLNTYIILKNKIDTRMVSTYGYCYPLGYGFINEVYLKHNLNDYNINTINKNIAPSSKIFQFSFNNRASQYEILINYNLSEIKKIKKKFKIIESNNNCHLIKYSHD